MYNTFIEDVKKALLTPYHKRKAWDKSVIDKAASHWVELQKQQVRSYYSNIVELMKKQPVWGKSCLWDSVPIEDRSKPMGISCQCPKCSPWSLSSGGEV